MAGPLSLFHRTTGIDSGNLAVINLNFKKADVEHWAGFNLRTSNLADVLQIQVLMTLLIKISAFTLTIIFIEYIETRGALPFFIVFCTS